MSMNQVAQLPHAKHPDEEMTAEELREALYLECSRNTALRVQLSQAVYWQDRLTNTLAKLCEAHLAGDTATVLADIGQMATKYKRHTQPIGSVH